MLECNTPQHRNLERFILDQTILESSSWYLHTLACSKIIGNNFYIDRVYPLSDVAVGLVVRIFSYSTNSVNHGRRSMNQSHLNSDLRIDQVSGER